MRKQSVKDRLLEEETCRIINKGGRILLKRKDGWYLSSWTNIAAGPDHAVWACKENALEIFNLKWAYAIASLYNANVVISYRKKK